MVDVALLFTSDGAIELNDFVLLHDDRELQPAEHVTPVVRTDTMTRFGPGPRAHRERGLGAPDDE